MRQYHFLLNAIREKGSYKEAARAGMPGSLSLFGHQSRYDLQDGFPLMTTKKMFWRGIVEELLWFLRGDTNIKYLDEHKVTKMWHEDAYSFYLTNFKNRTIYGSAEQVAIETAKLPYSFEEFCKTINETERKDLPQFMVSDHGGNNTVGKTYTLGDCGFQYGKVWRAWHTGATQLLSHNGNHQTWGAIVVDQIASVIKSIKAGPFGRRHLVTAIDPAHDKELALYWCHALFQFNCRKMTTEERYAIYAKIPRDQKASLSSDKFGGSDEETNQDLDSQNIPRYYLDCQLYQRSCDVLLGVPFNIASYALLTHVIAKVVGMQPGEFIHTYGDVHIYDNHKEAIEEQLGRDYTKYKLPTVQLIGDEWYSERVQDKFDFSGLTVDNFKLVGYESYPVLESDTTLSTGIKK